MTQEEMQKQIESMMPTPKQIVENIDKFPISHYDVNDLYNTYVTGARVGYWAAVERTSKWIYSQSVDNGIVLKSEEDIRQFIENYKERMKNKTNELQENKQH